MSSTGQHSCSLWLACCTYSQCTRLRLHALEQRCRRPHGNQGNANPQLRQCGQQLHDAMLSALQPALKALQVIWKLLSCNGGLADAECRSGMQHAQSAAVTCRH